MSRPLTVGTPATFKHTAVRYAPFRGAPESSIVLTSDPRSFFRSALTLQEAKARGEKKTRLKSALYYLDLSAEFAETAEASRLPASATLVYYSALNLVKAYICSAGVSLGNGHEHHGLSVSKASAFSIEVPGRMKDAISVFHEFSRLLGRPTVGRATLEFAEIVAHIPELHESVFRSGELLGKKRNFLPVDIVVLVDKSESWLFTDASYLRKHTNTTSANRFYSGRRKDYFRDARDDGDGRVTHRASRRRRFDWNSFPKVFDRICADYDDFDIASILSRSGYRFYCDLGNPNYHHLAYSYMLLFYLGSITRYEPEITIDLLNGSRRPIVSEALALLPNQFLYQIVSRATQNSCVVPYSSLS